MAFVRPPFLDDGISMVTLTEPYTTHLGDAWWYGDGLFEFLIPSEATGGLLAVFRATMPEGFSAPRHVHTRADEVFVVARVLGVMTPGGFESLFRELGVPARRRMLPEPGVVPFDVARVMTEQRRRGTEVVGPPMRA